VERKRGIRLVALRRHEKNGEATRLADVSGAML
jgi:hypothetical protein